MTNEIRVRADGPMARDLLPDVLMWADSALPVGAFSHSFGLETVFHERTFASGSHDLDDLLFSWLESEWAGVDGPAFTLAFAAATAGSPDRLREIDHHVNAMRLSGEWRRAGRHMGRQLLRLATALMDDAPAEAWPMSRSGSPSDSNAAGSGKSLAHAALHTFAQSVDAGEAPGQHPVGFGAVYAAWNVPLHWGLTAFLAAAVQALVAVAIRLVPLGQIDGQKLIRRLNSRGSHLPSRVAETDSLSQLGGYAPYFDIAGMRHEVLETRLFIS